MGSKSSGIRIKSSFHVGIFLILVNSSVNTEPAGKAGTEPAVHNQKDTEVSNGTFGDASPPMIMAFVESGIPGKYEMENIKDLKSDDMTALLKAMELKQPDIDLVQNSTKVTIIAEPEGSGFHYSIKGLIGDKEIVRSFESGFDYKEKRFDGRESSGKITIIGRSGIREQDYKSFKTQDVATFLPDGIAFVFTVQKESDVTKATLNFKRVK